MNDEIKALREEIAALRERVAVLESRPQVAPYTGPITPWPGPYFDQFKPPPWYPPFYVTCASSVDAGERA